MEKRAGSAHSHRISHPAGAGESAGIVKSRNALMDAAYDDQVYVDDRTIDSHVKRLRRKFKASDVDFDMIETLYGVAIVSRNSPELQNSRHRDWPTTTDPATFADSSVTHLRQCGLLNS